MRAEYNPPVTATQPRTVLKRRPWRTTEIEDGPVPVFVKRFHDARFPGPTVGRWRDLRRARREARILIELRAAGVSVPEVLGIQSTPEGVELRLEYLRVARRVGEVLDGSDRRLATRLGTLAAQLHEAGFAHGDGHLDNVLVDASGRCWIVDAASARSVTTSRAARDLVRAAAEAREVTTARFRARFLIAYLARMDPARRREREERMEVVEHDARIERRRHVAAENDRWFRESGVVVRLEDGERTLLVRRSLAVTEASALVRAAASGEVPPNMQVIRGHRAREAWSAHARLEEHRVSAARPLVLLESPTLFAVLTAPPGTRALRRDSPADARAVGALAGTLWDRGLALASPDVAIDEHGAAFVLLATQVSDATDLARHLAPWRGDGSTPFDWTSSAEFGDAFVAAQRGSRRQREAVDAALRARIA